MSTQQELGHRLHVEALALRENRELSASIAKARESQYAYLQANDLGGAAESAACEAISWRVAAGLEKNTSMLLQAESVMRQGVELARKSNDPTALALPLYQLAEIQEDLGNFSEALNSYNEAIKNMQTNPPATHNRPSVLADMKVHMYTCAYKSGDKSGLDQAKQALQELLDHEDPDSFNQHVWVSGAYMRFAEILRLDNVEEAKKYLEEAREIIFTDERLKVRKEQYELLASTLSV